MTKIGQGNGPKNWECSLTIQDITITKVHREKRLAREEVAMEFLPKIFEWYGSYDEIESIRDAQRKQTRQNRRNRHLADVVHTYDKSESEDYQNPWNRW